MRNNYILKNALRLAAFLTIVCLIAYIVISGQKQDQEAESEAVKEVNQVCNQFGGAQDIDKNNDENTWEVRCNNGQSFLVEIKY